MRVNTWSDREPGWWYKGLFQKKVLYLFSCILGLMVLAVAFSYWQYNRDAEKQWAEVEQLMIQRFGTIDPEELNPPPIGSSNFLETHIMVEFRETESFALNRIFSMSIWGANRDSSFTDVGGDRTDYHTWFEEEYTEKEAALEVLSVINNTYGNLVNELEVAIDNSTYRSFNVSAEIDLNGYENHVYLGTEFIYLCYFLCSRAHFHLIAGNGNAAYEDMVRVAKIYSFESQSSNQVSLMLCQYTHMAYNTIVAEGVKRHHWSKDHLNTFSAEFLNRPLVATVLKDSIAAEYFNLKPIIDLIDREGVRAVMSVDEDYGYLNYLFGDLKIDLLEYLDVDDIYDYEEIMPTILPSKTCKDNAAKILKYLLTDYFEALEKGGIQYSEIDTMSDEVLSMPDKKNYLKRSLYSWVSMLESSKVQDISNQLNLVGVKIEQFYLENKFYPDTLMELKVNDLSGASVFNKSWIYVKTDECFELSFPKEDLIRLKEKYPSRLLHFFDEN